MSQKYDEYLEKHRQAVKKAYQWIAAYIPELTDVEATRNIEFHDMSKNTPDEYTPYDNYFYGEQTPAIIEAFNRAWLMHIHRNPHHWQYWVLINDEPKAWYLAVSANAIGYDLETIMQMNVDKLKARYPDGFDAEHSLHRNQDDI